jgi:hypothetical protein
MKTKALFFFFLSVTYATQLTAMSFSLGSQLSLKHDAIDDRYIDGFGLFLSTRLDMHVDLFVQTGFHKWRTGVERTSPSNAHEFLYDQSTYLVGFRYWFWEKSSVMPYIHVMLGKNFDKIEYQVTTFSTPGHGISQSSFMAKENGRNAGLGFGFSFPVIKNLYYDMSVTTHAATQINSNVVLLLGFFYKLGF